RDHVAANVAEAGALEEHARDDPREQNRLRDERDRRDEAEHDRGDEMDSRDAARTQQPPIERPHRYGRGRDGTRAGSRPPGPASPSRASRSIGVFTSPKSSRPTRRRKTQYVHA